MYEYNDLNYLKEKLKTDFDKGLSKSEAIRRQNSNGKNVLIGKKRDTAIKIFFRQLKDPMIYILLIAIVISFILKEYSDAIVIAVVVMINAVIGTFQEIKTENALEILKKMSAHKCYVIRDGERILVDTSELVVGDLICLESGNSVGADVRLVESISLSIDESSITGESHPVNKNIDILDKSVRNLGDKRNLAYMSTLVVGGHGKGIVVSTGMKSEIGKIANLLKEEEVQLTPLQKRLFDLGKLLGIITIGVCALMFLVAVIEKRNVLDMLISSISLAVAAIPEGLPAVVTIVLAIGVQRMIKANTIVKRLPSVETLGSVSVVCTDKTGTLTENKLKCIGIYQDGKFSEESRLTQREMTWNLALCNNAQFQSGEYIGSPMEVALLKVLENNNIPKPNYIRLDELEFDSSRKMMSTLNVVDGKRMQFTKGAYDRIIKKCKYIRINGINKLLSTDDLKNLDSEIDRHAAKARRILAFAYKETNHIGESDLIFLGFVTFVDPPRDGVKEAISTFKNAGVRTIMITGDYAKTAFAIGQELGIVERESQCMSGEEIDKLSEKELIDIVETKNVFARVTPLHKAKIVSALKSNNHIVAMTGDGVNDAPSLKKADIGISMGINGSDVAKEASDMVLMDDNFSTIEVAIEEGRTIYNNIKKSVLFLLSSNFAEIIVMIAAIILGLPLPLLAIHILVVNLLTDSIPALALGADCKDEDVMKEPPRAIGETLFANNGMKNTILYGTLIALLTLSAFFIPVIQEYIYSGGILSLNRIKSILENRNVLSAAQTYAFVVLGLSELFYSLATRNLKKSVLRKNILKNKYLNIAILSGIAITAGMVMIPPLRRLFKLAEIGMGAFVALVCLSFSILMIHELLRLVVSRETSRRRMAKSPMGKQNKKAQKSGG